MKKILAALIGLGSITAASAQNLSGDIQLNSYFFNRDTSINASNNPLYDNILSGGESWMTLKYTGLMGFDAFLRVDAFHNSNLRNPINNISGFGIGAWSLSRSIKNLHVTAGYIYDQIGSGILFRAYEDRGLLIDNALVGVRLKYDLTDNISMRGFTGQSKNLFSRHEPIIKALAIDGNFTLNDDVFITPGIGILNRTLDGNSMGAIVNNINNQPLSQRFNPVYNMYALSAYNTLSFGDFAWYIEGAYKTKEAINNYEGNLVNEAGNVVFTSLDYARKGLAVNIVGKRTENFAMRTSPNETLLIGMINWQPILAQIRPQRVIARYTPASQDLSEIGGAANVMISPNINYDLNIAYTHINTLDNEKLYREVYVENNMRLKDKWIIDVGAQYLEYNQEFYQVKPGAGILKSFTPFTDITYRLDNKRSIKFQGQYQHMFDKEGESKKPDYGSWIFAGLEYAIAPKWSFAVSDMYNVVPGKYSPSGEHYYQLFTAYTNNANRFTLAYVKQVEGVNCTGGVCRYEPAFSGVRFGLTSSF